MQFIFALIACVVFAYLPGALMLRRYLVRTPLLIACAPLISFALLTIVSLLTHVLHLALFGTLGSALMLVIMCLAATALGLVLPAQHTVEDALSGVSWTKICVVLIASLALTLWMCAPLVEDPTRFSQGFDNTWHLGVIRQMMEDGDLFAISPKLYGEGVVNPGWGGGFYPGVWHVWATLSVLPMGASPALAVNAANLTGIGVILPLSLMALISYLFGARRTNPLLVVFAALAPAYGAWNFLFFGPLYPNLLGLNLLPVALVVIMATAHDLLGKKQPWVALLWLLGALLSLAMCHPNTVFSAAVFVAPYLVYNIYHHLWDGKDGFTVQKCMSVLGICVVLFGVWCVMYILPPLRAVIAFNWPPVFSPREALVHIANGSLRYDTAQLMMSVATLVGALALIVVAIKRRKQERLPWWLVITLALTLVQLMVVFCVLGYREAAKMLAADKPGAITAVGLSMIKTLVVGFWYADPPRLAAQTSYFAMPLIYFGIYTICSELAKLLPNKSGEKNVQGAKCSRRLAEASLVSTIAVVLIVINFFVGQNSAIAVVRQTIADSYTMGRSGTTVVEDMAFFSQVKPLVGDATVLNNQSDGSLFGAWHEYGIQLYWRRIGKVGTKGESENSKLMRTRAYQVATDSRVAEAFHAEGVKYVMKLADASDFAEGRRWPALDMRPGYFAGIMSITPETPGFKLLLADGARQLYEVVV